MRGVMTITEAMTARHAVRQFADRPIEGETLALLRDEAAACSGLGNLRIDLVMDEPEAFGGSLTHYGIFSGARNYMTIVGERSPDLQERVGYYGEKVVLRAQQLGLNTCWVAVSYRRKKCHVTLSAGEKMVCVIPVGYGVSPGVPHRNKPIKKLFCASHPIPKWFGNGMQAAMLAPTARNQQRFLLTLEGEQVRALATGGQFSNIDLGIVKCHFELGSGYGSELWV